MARKGAEPDPKDCPNCRYPWFRHTSREARACRAALRGDVIPDGGGRVSRVRIEDLRFEGAEEPLDDALITLSAGSPVVDDLDQLEHEQGDEDEGGVQAEVHTATVPLADPLDEQGHADAVATGPNFETFRSPPWPVGRPRTVRCTLCTAQIPVRSPRGRLPQRCRPACSPVQAKGPPQLAEGDSTPADFVRSIGEAVEILEGVLTPYDLVSVLKATDRALWLLIDAHGKMPPA